MMNILVRCIELCAVWGSNCASLFASYQPRLPKSLM